MTLSTPRINRQKKKNNYPEESHCAPALESPVRNIRLAGKIFGVLYWRNHPFHREESRQIRSVRRDDDQREEPPYATHDTRARSLIKRSLYENAPNY